MPAFLFQIGSKLTSLLFGGFPRILFLPGLMGKWSTRVVLQASPNGNFTFEGKLSGTSIDVSLPKSSFLKKNLTFPIAAQGNLERVISMQIRQSVPDQARSFNWQFQIEEKTKTDIKVAVFLLKQSVIETLLKAAQQAGTQLRTVSLANSSGILTFADFRQQTDHTYRIWNGITAVLAVFLVAYVYQTIGFETKQLRDHTSSLQQQMTDLTTKAVSAREQNLAKDASLASIQNDIDTFESEHRRLSVLLELTENLTDNTWISEFSIDGKNLRLSGFVTGDIPDVITQIEQMDCCSRAQLDGSVFFDSYTRSNRFDLTAELASFPRD